MNTLRNLLRQNNPLSQAHLFAAEPIEIVAVLNEFGVENPQLSTQLLNALADKKSSISLAYALNHFVRQNWLEQIHMVLEGPFEFPEHILENILQVATQTADSKTIAMLVKHIEKKYVVDIPALLVLVAQNGNRTRSFACIKELVETFKPTQPLNEALVGALSRDNRRAVRFLIPFCHEDNTVALLKTKWFASAKNEDFIKNEFAQHFKRNLRAQLPQKISAVKRTRKM